MIKVFIILMAAGAAMAYDADAGPGGSSISLSGQGYDDITLTSVNDFQMTGVTNLRGIDCYDTGGGLFLTDYSDDMLYLVDDGTGAVSNSWPVDPAIPSILGVAHKDVDNHLLVNDWQSMMDFYDFIPTTWTLAFPSPIPSEPRGIDVDPVDGYVWGMDATDHQLYRFNITGGSVTSWPDPGVGSGYSCGIATFPYMGDVGIVLGGYSWNDFYFLRYDGSDIVMLGSAPTPQAASSSYGIAYSEAQDTFFWVYKDSGGNFRICQFDVTITSLERDTWGAIKTAF